MRKCTWNILHRACYLGKMSSILFIYLLTIFEYLVYIGHRPNARDVKVVS
jgi:hypothetical protein